MGWHGDPWFYIVYLKFEADFVLVIEENTKNAIFSFFFPKKLSEYLESSNVLLFHKPEKVSTIFEHRGVFVNTIDVNTFEHGLYYKKK